MRRNLVAVCILVGICVAAFLGTTIYGFVKGILIMGILGVAMTFVSLWVLTGSIYREETYERFERRFKVKDYQGALAVLDKASRNYLLFPIFRVVAYQLYLRAELAVDNVSEAARYADLLRHIGGDGWKYRTAYFVVLFNLDRGDRAAAQKEFLDFERDCGKSELYRRQIEELRILFKLIDGEEVELPESVRKSEFPIVRRLVGRYEDGKR